jgi:hypothetical protein
LGEQNLERVVPHSFQFLIDQYRLIRQSLCVSKAPSGITAIMRLGVPGGDTECGGS